MLSYTTLIIISLSIHNLRCSGTAVLGMGECLTAENLGVTDYVVLPNCVG